MRLSGLIKKAIIMAVSLGVFVVSNASIVRADQVPPVPSVPPLVSYVTINTATEQVIAFDANNNPLQVFACSTGARGNTTVGTYKTTDYYEWRLMMGNCWSRYAVRFNRGELMHSVPYYRRSPDSLEYRQYNRLGTPASAGCCRLAMIDAKWIYENTIPGTTVQVIHDPNFIFPLTRQIIKIDENDVVRRGWDPTDMDPRNPYFAIPQ